MLTLDANVWIAAYDPRDRFHSESAAFLQVVSRRGLHLYGPSILLVEIACALARRAQDATVGEAAVARLRQHPNLVLHPANEQVLASAAALGSRHLLRGVDAVYAATAALLDAPLVSWDQELVRRAGAITPSDWLAA